MKDNLLGRLIGSEFSRVNGDVRIGRFFVGIRDAGKLFDNARSRFGVETFAIAFFARMLMQCLPARSMATASRRT